MLPSMAPLPLLVAALLVASDPIVPADAPEVITLDDGRALVGRYDAAQGLLRMAPGYALGLHVAAERIAARRPARPEEVPEERVMSDADRAQQALANARAALHEIAATGVRRGNLAALLREQVVRVESRRAAAEAAAAAGEQAVAALDAAHREEWAKREELAQQRALLEQRISLVAVHQRGDAPANVEAVEWQRTLTAARARLRELDARLADIAFERRAAADAVAARRATAAAESRSAAMLRERLANLAREDERAAAERARLQAVIDAAVPAGAPAP